MVLMMARPFKYRKICFPPECSIFKPAGIPKFELEEIVLTVDEFESLRLADLEGMYQEDAAREMDVSRQTFGNILKMAHRKIAEGIVRGKAIKIEGGIYRMEGKRIFSCQSCQHEWEIAYGTARPASCPNCQSKYFHRSHKDRRCGRRRHTENHHGGVK
jgi:predicted DNA-binding protein (UPF0251 family)